ncbi:MAG: tRNA (adenosine(37)-N6)-threonylcarbamoyltransferase complex dimerization subunit type 1 TsaB [Alphaproteobacteria bacterium]|nr:tRNA (adenosine(37)-N6)-threonylcarbamoyltransferase complex dimerization subunit type 1 TsaB [Alphaproteobacteria bacterium]
MRILAVDAALDACSVAIADAAGVRAARSEAMARGQAERIALMARDAMAEADVAFDALDRIVVTTGPGSFTGVRIGLAFARGLSLALSIPCVGVSTLEALALERGGDGLRGATIVTPGACYAALYRDGVAVLTPQRVERAVAAATLRDAAAGAPFVLRGPGATVTAQGIDGATAEDAAHVDIRALAIRGAMLDPASAPPTPLYLRAPLSDPP